MFKALVGFAVGVAASCLLIGYGMEEERKAAREKAAA